MRDPLRHLPFALGVFVVLVMGMVNQLIGVDSRVYITLLAPVLWMGLYILFGTEHAASKE